MTYPTKPNLLSAALGKADKVDTKMGNYTFTISNPGGGGDLVCCIRHQTEDKSPLVFIIQYAECELEDLYTYLIAKRRYTLALYRHLENEVRET